MTTDALIVVDVQNDFLPGGSLAVPNGDEVIAPLNRLLAQFSAAGRPVFATRDWHPENHCSFKAQGGPWPPHCIAESRGAEFAAELRLPDVVEVISKATTPEAEAYSGFEGTGLERSLRDRGVTRLIVGGLATDYCVRQTVEDALTAGFDVVVLEDAVRAVDVEPGDGDKALAAMVARGARRTKSTELEPGPGR